MASHYASIFILAGCGLLCSASAEEAKPANQEQSVPKAGAAPKGSAGEKAAEGAAGAEEEEEYEPPPEGYEERVYPVSDLLNAAPDYPGDQMPVQAQVQSGSINPFSDGIGVVQSAKTEFERHLLRIIQTCVTPDSWRKRGPARIRFEDQKLVAIQTREAHEEIRKTLAWLKEGVDAQFQATLLAVPARRELANRLLNDPRPLGGTELWKVLEEGGAAAGARFIEFRGAEGQLVQGRAGDRQSYIADLDVSGAVYDPVMRAIWSGLSVKMLLFRAPDCISALMDFEIGLSRDLAMASMAISGGAGMAMEVRQEQKKEGKETPAPPKILQDPDRQTLKASISLPTRKFGLLHSFLGAPLGKYVPLGSINLHLAEKDETGQRLVFFACARIGTGKVPTLEQAGGLKPGEFLRLYPTLAFSYQPKAYEFQMLELSGDEELGGSGTNPFAPAQTGNVAPPTFRRTSATFQEKVRQDKLVEPAGPALFTRLPEATHAKLAATLNSDLRRRFAPLRIRAIAAAIPAERYRKLVLEGGAAEEAAGPEALLAEPGAALLAEQDLCLALGQASIACAGELRDFLGDYEISGDSYDPIVRSLFNNGFVLSVKAKPACDQKSCGLDLKFSLFPHPSQLAKTMLETTGINQGAEVTVIQALAIPIELPKVQVVTINTTLNPAFGRYHLAGAQPMPPGSDGKPDPRQVLLFVKVDKIDF